MKMHRLIDRSGRKTTVESRMAAVYQLPVTLTLWDSLMLMFDTVNWRQGNLQSHMMGMNCTVRMMM